MITWRLACRQVSYEAGGPLFTGGPDGAFTPLERIHSAARPGREGLGGRLAAKLAVADLLGRGGADAALLRQIGILPRPRHHRTVTSLAPRVARAGPGRAAQRPSSMTARAAANATPASSWPAISASWRGAMTAR
jgi:hypothetical protein